MCYHITLKDNRTMSRYRNATKTGFIDHQQNCSCRWQVKSNIPEYSPLDLNFTMLFHYMMLNCSFQKVNTEQSCSCMWQVKSNIPEFPPLDLNFTMEYRCLLGTDETRSLTYTFSFENYQVRLIELIIHQ